VIILCRRFADGHFRVVIPIRGNTDIEFRVNFQIPPDDGQGNVGKLLFAEIVLLGQLIKAVFGLHLLLKSTTL